MYREDTPFEKFLMVLSMILALALIWVAMLF